jgi:hypothetical protein
MNKSSKPIGSLIAPNPLADATLAMLREGLVARLGHPRDRRRAIDKASEIFEFALLALMPKDAKDNERAP